MVTCIKCKKHFEVNLPPGKCRSGRHLCVLCRFLRVSVHKLSVRLRRSLKSRKNGTRVTLKCAQCDCDFVANRKRQRFCSIKCGSRLNRIAQQQLKCIICEKVFVCKSTNTGKYCSLKCRRSSPVSQANKLKHWIKRRKGIYKASNVNVNAVFLRDNYACVYCGRKVRRYTHGGYLSGDEATIDHVVPLRSGGEHHESNIVTSCWDCNVCKKRGSVIDYFDGWEHIRHAVETRSV